MVFKKHDIIILNEKTKFQIIEPYIIGKLIISDHFICYKPITNGKIRNMLLRL